LSLKIDAIELSYKAAEEKWRMTSALSLLRR